MKHTLLIILLLSLSVGFSQQIIHTETYENGNIKSITYHKKSRTGIERVKYEGYYEHGQKKTEGTWKDGERDGLQTRWHDNGKKDYETTYKDGEGLWGKQWDKYGNMKRWREGM